MQLTAQTTDTFRRRLASASNLDLEAIEEECKATARDPNEPADVRLVSKRLATLTRALRTSRA